MKISEKQTTKTRAIESLLHYFERVNNDNKAGKIQVINIYYNVVKTSCDIKGNYKREVQFYLPLNNELIKISALIRDFFVNEGWKINKNLRLNIYNEGIHYAEVKLKQEFSASYHIQFLDI